jgi:hypothetical protein
MGGVLLAESNVDGRMSNVDGASAQQSTINNRQSPANPAVQQSTINNRQSPTPVGYVISRDRYLKRDELGVIYQLCVAPGTQRKLVGASLIAEVFRRSAYGCKL